MFPGIAPSLRVLALLSALVLPAAARAEDDAPRAATAAEPSAEVGSAQVARMVQVLDSQLPTARLWYWGWSGFYGTVIIGETVLNGTSSGGARVSADVNVVTSVFGLFSTLLLPPPVLFDWEPVGRMPEATPEQRAAKSAAIRALFAREVAKERFYHSVWNHIIGLAVNAGVCAYMYWGLHIGGRTLLNLFAGSLIWEANVFTSPNASLHLSAELEKTSSLQLQLVPMALGPSGAGLGMVGHF
jgi:hypothetical protein